MRLGANGVATTCEWACEYRLHAAPRFIRTSGEAEAGVAPEVAQPVAIDAAGAGPCARA